jgi:NAD(P)-dependent dehydrogenase (short-subunit alcohol dehydrogenase family)
LQISPVAPLDSSQRHLLTTRVASVHADDGAHRERPCSSRITRQAQPEEIGEFVAFLGSDAAANVNGAVITSDGGWMAA